MSIKRVFTGIKPTGDMPHIGNLVGAILPMADLAQGHDATVFIPDLHALTTVRDAETLRRQCMTVALTYLAVYGLESPIRIFRQSDVVGLPKLNWILNNVTPYSLMLRAHSFKDAQAKGLDLNMGVFNYPILMAADILGYDNDIVPVGKDQQQHLEFARDIAESFNRTYGQEIFKLPTAHISSVPVLPGTDGRKMSKSYNNFIGVFDDETVIRKKVASIKTDSRGVAELKDPDTCSVFALVSVFGTAEETQTIRQRYLAGGYGYGDAKKALADILVRYLSPIRERRDTLLQSPHIVDERLADGARIMNARLDEVMLRVAKVTGV